MSAKNTGHGITEENGKCRGRGSPRLRGATMDFHLEREVRLHTGPEYKNLYKWAINEIDAEGKKIERDRIPWQWTLYFTATSCRLHDNIEVKSQYPREGTTPEQPKIEQCRFIRVQLRPGSPHDEGNYHRQTTYSMFGTARA